VRALAKRFEYPLVRISSTGSDLAHETGSDWLLLSRNQAFINNPQIAGRASAPGRTAPVLWTDDYSNLLQILK